MTLVPPPTDRPTRKQASTATGPGSSTKKRKPTVGLSLDDIEGMSAQEVTSRITLAKSSLSAKRRVLDKGSSGIVHPPKSLKTVIEHSPKSLKTVIEHSSKPLKTVIEHSPILKSKSKTVIEHLKPKTVIEHLKPKTVIEHSKHIVSPRSKKGKKRTRVRSVSPPARKQLIPKPSGRLSRKESLKAMSQIDSASRSQGRVKGLYKSVSDLMDLALEPCSVNLGDSKSQIDALFTVGDGSSSPDLFVKTHPDNAVQMEKTPEPSTSSAPIVPRPGQVFHTVAGHTVAFIGIPGSDSVTGNVETSVNISDIPIPAGNILGLTSPLPPKQFEDTHSQFTEFPGTRLLIHQLGGCL